MAVVELTPALRAEYLQLFDSCDIRPDKQAAVDTLVAQIASNRARYERAGSGAGIPWYFIGTIHSMEASLSFTKHLHNGDPLTARTVQVPAGRPLVWNPPNDWESSCEDALMQRNLEKVTDWSLAGTLYQLEGYNGFGYRRFHHDVRSPYLWSYSNHYTTGKYVADGTFDPDAVSKQCGSAVILRRMAESGLIQFNQSGDPLVSADEEAEVAAAPLDPLVTYSETEASDAARKLQRALNSMPGIFLLVDGVPGRRTSDAFRKVTGNFLQGDPRSASAAAGS